MMLADVLFIAGTFLVLAAVLMLGWVAGRAYERSCHPPGRVVVVRDLPRDEITERRRAREQGAA